MRLTWITTAALLIVSGTLYRGGAKDLTDHAHEFKTQLTEKLMPYWHDTAQDKEHGGYLLADDAKTRKTPTEKQLVTQTRMIWTFSHVHRKGYGDGKRNYLKAAEQGYRFLLDHFLDKNRGGYYWKTDLAGKVTNDRKIIYGQAFAIYVLVEYHRASGDKEPLQRAKDLYQALQSHAHDSKRGGWVEHFTSAWQPILKPEPGAEVEVPGLKSANTHLHLMEALTELYDVTRDDEIKRSLVESLRINTRMFYPKDAGKSCFHRTPNWREVTDAKSAGLSYGHNVEFAWLMIRAEEILGVEPSWEHFNAHIQHALKYGYDHERGGVYNRGVADQPASQTDKIWWVQAEMMAALSDALRHKTNAAYAMALDKLLHFVSTYQADPADGVWLDTVAADGTPKNTAKAHSWKANYHDVRAIVKFLEAVPLPR